MRLSTASFLAVAVAPIAVSAAPFRRGTDNGTATVLQFAHVLEQLETQFYTQALQKFQPSDFTAAGFTSATIPVQEFTAIQSDESTHVTALESVLQSFAITPLSCTFDFSSVLTSVSAMAPVARVVENVVVGAYLGAAHLVGDPVVLTAAASIMTVEARHQSILNVLSGATAIPQAFDLGLLPQEVLAIAGAFITGSCDLGITPNPSLAVTNTGTVTTGTSLTFSSSAINGSTSGFFCQMLTGNLPFSISLPFDQCVVPSGINGPVGIWITSDDQPLPNNVIDRQSNAIVAGPLLTFIDTQPEALGELVRNTGNNGTAAAPPSTTQTLPPAQASSLLSSLSGVPTSTSAAAAPPVLSGTPSGNNAANGSAVIPNGISMVPVPTTSA